jgi:hypothetical protein
VSARSGAEIDWLTRADTNLGAWAITIHRRKTLRKLDSLDLKRAPDCVFAVILSGFEISVIIVVARIPLMRPLFRRKRHGSLSNRRYHENDHNEEAHTKK